jgi:hypothetical protein
MLFAEAETKGKIAMPRLTLEERVAALEQQVMVLKAAVENGVGQKDWRSTIGMFSGNEAMKRIEKEGRKWREAERRKIRRKQVKSQRKKA